METVLFDTQYIGRCAQHTTGGMRSGSDGTGVLFGIFRDLVEVMDTYQTERVVLFFDSPITTLRRRLLHPGYKLSRQQRRAEQTEAEQTEEAEFHAQIARLRDELLPRFATPEACQQAEGYEADDLIAAWVEQHHRPGEDRTLIVSADADLHQLLRPGLACRTRKGDLTTHAGFVAQWGIEPKQWATAKAIAGCSTDDVPGVRGVGEATAIKWLTGQLTHGVKHDAIQEAHAAGQIRQSLQLVTLPLPGTPTPEALGCGIDRNSLQAVLDSLHIRAFRADGLAMGASKPRGTRPPMPQFMINTEQ